MSEPYLSISRYNIFGILELTWTCKQIEGIRGGKEMGCTSPICSLVPFWHIYVHLDTFSSCFVQCHFMAIDFYHLNINDIVKPYTYNTYVYNTIHIQKWKQCFYLFQIWNFMFCPTSCRQLNIVFRRITRCKLPDNNQDDFSYDILLFVRLDLNCSHRACALYAQSASLF